MMRIRFFTYGNQCEAMSREIDNGYRVNETIKKLKNYTCKCARVLSFVSRHRMHWFCSHECALFFSNPKRIELRIVTWIEVYHKWIAIQHRGIMHPDSRTRRLTAQKLHLMAKITVCLFDGLRNCATLIQCANM